MGPWGLVTPGRQAQAANRWIKALGIRCQNQEQKVLNLSGGNQQKVAFSRLLHHQVDILLLDEPTRGIDVAAKAAIYQLIDQLASGTAQYGGNPKAILVISSYLPELMGICDRIGVMCRGQLSQLKNTSEWDEHSLMLAATGQELQQK
jgi:ribose transport system ATP-binding protein